MIIELITKLAYNLIFYIKFRLKSELQYKSKIIDDLQTQMKELRQLHTSGLVINNDHSKILEKVYIIINVILLLLKLMFYLNFKIFLDRVL